MKKLIALVLVIALMASLAGCCCCMPLAECEVCEEFTFCQERTVKFSSEKMMVCEDCYDSLGFMFK